MTKENKRIKLIHNYSGKSLLELRKKFGVGSSGFYDNDWWLKEKFAKEHPPKGKYEIELRDDLVDKTFTEQVKELKDKFKPVHPAILAEMILEHFKRTGERLNGMLWYRTLSVASDGRRVDVGGLDAGGLRVDVSWDGSRRGNLGVSSARKLSKSRRLKTLESLNLTGEIIEIKGLKYKLTAIDELKK